MKIRILAVGRKSAGWVAAAEKEYCKRLSRFTDIACELVSPEDEHRAGPAAAAAKESAGLSSRRRPGETVIACDRRGRSYTSEQFAAELERLLARGSKLCFVIGGSHGLTDAALEKADLTVSFSSLTFAHGLFRVLLLEQLYRAFSILTGGKYHK